MNANALRTWGIAASAAVITGAMVLAMQPAPQAAARAESTQIFAQAENTAAPLAFVVRFRGAGPIARAQANAARGRTSAAQAQIEAQLRRQSDFRGLCFDRFTAGAAEVVLRTCAAIVPSERERVQQSWLERLRAMRAVEYADVNATATQNRAG
jgi:hypothetical protein